MDIDSTPEPEDCLVPAQNSPQPDERGIPSALLDWRLFGIVSAILIMLSVLFIFGIRLQWTDYRDGISAAGAGKLIDHAAMLAYNRAFGAAIIKTSALFLGYLLVFTGVLFVLRSSEVAYSLALEVKDSKGTLQTTSPGLVIITLGVVLIAITILTKSSIDYKAPSESPMLGQEQSQQESEAQPVESQPSLPTTTAPSERTK